MAYTTIKKPSDYFNTKIYTGDGSSSRDITGVGFQPDWIWIKNRDITQWYFLFDALRGVSKALFSNTTNVESTQAATHTAFLSDGFTVGNDVASNGNGNGIVSWNWLGANGTASNTDGSISSTVSANTTSGFSIVSYTGTSANATVGHGLGSAPKMIIVKNRSGTQGWGVYHASLGNTKYLQLNDGAAEGTASTFWNNTTPTNQLFSIGTSGWVNDTGSNYIAYCFAEKTGYSKFGSYTGNGSTDGTFVYTGFKPAWVLVKCTSAQADWELSDNKRTTSGGNVIDKEVRPNTDGAETGGTDGRYIDYVSNGFKLRQGFGNWNDSGATYIFMAFAEQPLVGDNPATAR